MRWASNGLCGGGKLEWRFTRVIEVHRGGLVLRLLAVLAVWSSNTFLLVPPYMCAFGGLLADNLSGRLMAQIVINREVFAVLDEQLVSREFLKWFAAHLLAYLLRYHAIGLLFR